MIKDLITQIYGPDGADDLIKQIDQLLEKYASGSSGRPIDETDVLLITYGDQLHAKGESNLKSLHRFLNSYLKGSITSVHLLPFYPYTSDDGFSVLDYYAVNPSLGSWKDIEELSGEYRLMFDAVINHISQESGWMKSYLDGDPDYQIILCPRIQIRISAWLPAHVLRLYSMSSRRKRESQCTYGPPSAKTR